MIKNKSARRYKNEQERLEYGSLISHGQLRIECNRFRRTFGILHKFNCDLLILRSYALQVNRRNLV